jgi:DNA helicase HerA-like ATPase
MLGTTGTGKSCALTLILKRILEQSPNGHVLLLDPHSEYGRAFGDRAEHLSAKNFKLPFWLCTFEELAEIVLGDDPTKTADEAMHLRDLVLAAKLAAAKLPQNEGWITPDTPVPCSIGDLNRHLDAACGRLDNRVNLPALMRLKARLASLQMDKRYAFMFDTGFVLQDELPGILGRLFRMPTNGKPLAILDLSSIPSEVLNCVVAVICRLAFDFAVVAGQDYPLLLVCEEAHRYAPQDVRLGFGPAKRALARIAKEGRKYGIGLGLISQRPSELSSTILSQCNTVFAFRMLNERDQEIIQANLAEASPSMFSALPFLGNSEAIVIGEGVPVPMRLRFADLPEGERPQSHSASFSERWRQGAAPAPAVLTGAVQGLRR